MSASTSGAVLCIGVFDGVHRGHQALLGEARRRADASGLPLVAVTFNPHPITVIDPSQTVAELASLARRTDLLRAAGADEVAVLAFTPAMAAMSPEEFIDSELVARLRAREVVIGEDFRFGHGAEGSVQTLIEAGAPRGFTVTPIGLAGEGGERWSSTAIRAMVSQGDVAAAARALGRDYAIDGVIVHGDHRGRELGYPTANLAWDYPAAIPADGVYAGWLAHDGARLPAAISVGSNPQFDGTERRVESYVLGRDDLDLYGEPVTVDFAAHLRGQATFADVPALIEQMARDVQQAADVLEADRS